ncbi:MAG: aspartate carbamoyltransferase regulatory subunit [Nitrososphaerota archaeon]
MTEEQLLVRRIKEGTVLDHVEAGSALRVLSALNIQGKEGYTVTIAMNVPSGKMGKKDIVKIADRFLSREETNRIALIAPRATVNLIKDYRVIEKRSVELPDSFIDVFRCPNPTCISNSKEPIRSIIDMATKSPPLLRCRYCGRLLEPQDLL